jgi:hypothetical protein
MLHRPPRIDVEATGAAVKAFIGKFNQRHGVGYADFLPRLLWWCT